MKNETLTILTYNVLFGPADGELLRANRRSMEILKSLINLDKQNSIDVICFQEFWDSICEDYGVKTLGKFLRLNGLGNYYKKNFLKYLRKIGFKYTVDLGRQWGKLKGSGLLIVSKYPIIESKHYYFSTMKKEVSNIDSFASKGILLAKIKKNDMIFNIINTHYQAWVKNYKQRVLASLAMKNFIKENITDLKEPVIICGDLNEDRIHLPKRVSLLYKIMDVIEPKRLPNTSKFTYNRKKNEFVGLDGSKYTFSQAIDYILYSKLHKQPINANYKIIQLQSDKKYLANIKRHGKHIMFTKQLSDHYPVLGKFKF